MRLRWSDVNFSLKQLHPCVCRGRRRKLEGESRNGKLFHLNISWYPNIRRVCTFDSFRKLNLHLICEASDKVTWYHCYAGSCVTWSSTKVAEKLKWVENDVKKLLTSVLQHKEWNIKLWKVEKMFQQHAKGRWTENFFVWNRTSCC